MSNILSAVTRQNLSDFISVLEAGWRPSRVNYDVSRGSEVGYYMDYSIWTEVVLRDWVDALKELHLRFPDVTLSPSVWEVALKNSSSRCVEFLWHKNEFKASAMTADFEHQCLLALIAGMGEPWSPPHEIKDILPVYKFLKAQGVNLTGVVRGAFEPNDLRMNGHSLWTRAVFIKNWDLVQHFWPASSSEWRGWVRLNEMMFHLMNVVVGDYRSLAPSMQDTPPEEEVLFRWLGDFAQEWMVSPTVPSTLLLVDQPDFGVSTQSLVATTGGDSTVDASALQDSPDDPAFHETERAPEDFSHLLERSQLNPLSGDFDSSEFQFPPHSIDGTSPHADNLQADRRQGDRRQSDRRTHAGSVEGVDASLEPESNLENRNFSPSASPQDDKDAHAHDMTKDALQKDDLEKEEEEFRFDWNALMKESGYEVQEECEVQPIPLYRALSRPTHEKISAWLRLPLMVKKERRDELWKIWDYVLGLDCELAWLHELAMYPDDPDVQKVILLARLDHAVAFHRFWFRPSASGFSAHDRWVNMGGDVSVVELWVPQV